MILCLYLCSDEDNEARDGQLDGRKTPFFGDQLTRERLQRAKGLRRVVEPINGSFEDIGPFFCTLWHVKQDFLEVNMQTIHK